ncbi:MAG: 50S ribosomal protein L18 [Acholeplasmataceae bacterium]|jgi:large subunit ribosomal protein L18|nr:50S ribosomal protein L18 [Acholeplasmataceae bacterium]MDD2260451.1 50S ribosomal protein L18 [Acholeplasmataceae bacterium]MDD4468995.1 50S ribosomal protein L18 [Acholeplasmataceae bacterium]MDD4823770.1 50S ribosomal protein L18 [Acholeplasmataceae bacterium]
MIKKLSSNEMRQKRHLRIRAHLHGSADRPRLSVYRSNKQFYVQLIDDEAQVTLAFAHSSEVVPGVNMKSAEAVGKLIAERALEKGITKVVFDRSGYLYHGRVKTLAEAARAAGLEF